MKIIGLIILAYAAYCFYVDINKDEVMTTMPFGIAMIGGALAGFPNDIKLTLGTIVGWILVFFGAYKFIIGFDSGTHSEGNIAFISATISYFIGMLLLGFKSVRDNFPD